MLRRPRRQPTRECRSVPRSRLGFDCDPDGRDRRLVGEVGNHVADQFVVTDARGPKTAMGAYIARLAHGRLGPGLS